MKAKSFITVFLLISCVMGLGAQSIYKNEFYLKSLEYKISADQKYEAGQYDAAYADALEAEKYAKLSDEFIAKKQLQFKANTAYLAAKARIDYADSINLIGFNPTLYQDAQDTLEAAKNLYDIESYEDSMAQSQRVLDLLKDIAPQPIEIPPAIVQALPKYYTVRLIPEKRDCFWRIAEYEFVYADGTKWRVLYDANKDKIQDPNNPHLIQPGQVFEIPVINGETREGMYDPEIDYPSFNDIK